MPSNLRRILRLAAIGLAPVALATVAAGDPLILADDLEDETVGLAPSTADVGTVAITSGTHTVALVGGDKVVESACAAEQFSLVNWFPSDSSSSRVILSSRQRIAAAPGLDSINAVATIFAALRGAGGGEELSLQWGDDGKWRFESAGVVGDYSVGTEYDLVFDADFVADTIDLWINGVLVADDVSMPNDPVGLLAYYVSCNTPTAATVHTDDVRAVEEPVFLHGHDLHSPMPWSATSPSQPVGDECTWPGLLGQGSDTPGTLAGHTGGSGNDSSCGGTGDTIDHWFLYVAQCTGTATISTCLPATEFDSVLAAFDGCGGSEVACNDDSVSAAPECFLGKVNRKSEISFAVTAGVTYPVRVSVFGDSFPTSDDKDFAIRAECAAAP